LGVPPKQQCILLAGSALEDHRLLAEYRIQRESTLHVLDYSGIARMMSYHRS
jgi:hypothetical protein